MSTTVMPGSWPASDRRPLWHFVASWILLIPLLFFATKGGFLHENDQAHMTDFTHDISATDALRDRVEQIGIWVICLAFMLPHARRIIANAARSKVIVAIPLLALLSAAWAPDPFESFRRGIYLSLTVFFGLYLAERYDAIQQMRLFLFVGYVAALLCLVAVVFLPRYALGFTGEWKGIFGHKNDMGVLMIFLMTPAFHLRGESRALRLLYILTGALLIYKSDSKTAWIIFLAYLGYVAAIRLLGRIRRLEQIFLILFTSLTTGLVGVAIYQNLGVLTATIGKNSTFSGRTRIWAAVMTAIWKHPLLGYGYGGFWRGFVGESGNLMSSIGFSVGHAHSGYLNIWLQLGAVGLGLFIAALLNALRDALVCLKPNRPVWTDWYIGLIILVIISNLDESYILNINEMTTILFVVACVGLYRLSHGTPLTALKKGLSLEHG